MIGQKSDKVNVSTNYKFYVLNGTNYGSWKWQFLNVMRALKYVPKLLDAKHESPDQDAEALALLGSTLDEKNARTIQNYTTFKEAFEAIVRMHENKTADEKQSLFERLNSYRIEDASKVNEGIGEIMEIVAQLKSMKETISDTNVIGVMSASLPSDFDMFKAAWKVTPQADRTIEEFTSRVFAEASELIKRKGDTEKANALITKSRQRFDKNTEFCRYCKDSGHNIKDCKKLKTPYDPNYRKRSQNKNNVNSNNAGDSNVQRLAFTVCTDKNRQNIWQWVADSGCTHHMTPFRELFVEIKPFEDEVGLADSDSKLKATGKGSIQTKQGTLTEVYLVPKLAQSLFSIRSAAKHGLNYIGCDKSMRFFKGQKEIFRANLEENLYINFEPLQDIKVMAATRKIWHKRFGHAAESTVDHMVKHSIVNDLDIVEEVIDKCEPCVISKCHNVPHPTSKRKKSQTPGEVLHVDTSGKVTPVSLGGAQYIVLCKDECTDFRQVAFVSNKSKIPDVVKKFITTAKLETSNDCLKLVCDNGSEYINANLSKFLNDKGIVIQTSSPYVPQQNGFIERDFRTISEAARSMLNESKLDRKLWAEATNCAVYVLNRTSNADMTPYERWTGTKPSVGNFHMFGELAIIKHKQHTTKFQDKGEKAIFIGYTESFNTFRFLVKGDVKRSCDCVFMNRLALSSVHDNNAEAERQAEEDKQEVFIIPAQSNNDNSSDLHTIEDPSTSTESRDQEDSSLDTTPKFVDENRSYHESSTSNDHQEFASFDASTTQREATLTSTPIQTAQTPRLDSLGRPIPARDSAGRFLPNTNGRRKRSRANLIALQTGVGKFPKKYTEARERVDWLQWKNAMEEEMNSLDKNEVYEEIPEDTATSKPVASRWVLTQKFNADGSICKYKGRVVAKGYTQRFGVDFTETYCPVVNTITLRMILASSQQKSLHIRQFDVKTAFLYAKLDETIFMIPPDGYKKPGKLWRLKRSLYGLRQASRMWNKTFDEFLKSLCLKSSRNDPCIYYKLSPIIIIIIYVDDGLVCAEKEEDAKQMIRLLEQRFEIHELNLVQYRGLQLECDHEGITIHQSNYVQTILVEFGMQDSTPVDNPMVQVRDKSVDNNERFSDQGLYRQAVGCLIYLAESSRPDIVHAVNRVSRRVDKPCASDWKAVKRIFRYLRGQPTLGVRYQKCIGKMVAYCDASFADDPDTAKSTTGYVILYGDAPIHWKSQRQKLVTTASTEAEYVALCTTSKEVIWLRKIGLELGIIDPDPIKVLSDNQSAIRIARSERVTPRTRHLFAQEVYVHELVANKELDVSFVRGRDQIADFLTKAVPTGQFCAARDHLMVPVTRTGSLGA